jgi:uridine phosphorylase
MTIDYLYHLGLDSGMNLQGMFGDVRLVIMGGSKERALMIARQLTTDNTTLPKPIGRTDRYHIYKVGSCLSVSHGMGAPSISILLHELYKLLFVYAKTEAEFVRIGTSGGIGIEPGTVVITTESVNERNEAKQDLCILGRLVSRPTYLSPELIDKLYNISTSLAIPCRKGKTMSCNDFYESQARMDGAICNYTKEDREEYLNRLAGYGVLNIEMEGVAFAAFCFEKKIKCCMITTVLLNRLNGDQVKAELSMIGALQVLLRYVEESMTRSKEDH